MPRREAPVSRSCRRAAELADSDCSVLPGQRLRQLCVRPSQWAGRDLNHAQGQRLICGDSDAAALAATGDLRSSRCARGRQPRTSRHVCMHAFQPQFAADANLRRDSRCASFSCDLQPFTARHAFAHYICKPASQAQRAAPFAAAHRVTGRSPYTLPGSKSLRCYSCASCLQSGSGMITYVCIRSLNTWLLLKFDCHSCPPTLKHQLLKSSAAHMGMARQHCRQRRNIACLRLHPDRGRPCS